MFTTWKGTYHHTTPNPPNNYKSTKVFPEILFLFVCLFVVAVFFFLRRTTSLVGCVWYVGSPVL